MKTVIIASMLLLSTVSSFAGVCKADHSENFKLVCLQKHELMYLEEGLVVSCGAVEQTTFENNHFQLSSGDNLAVRNASISGKDEAGFTKIICASR